MDSETSDRARIIAPPPLIWFGFLGAGYLLHLLWPVTVFEAQGRARLIAGGGLAGAACLVFWWSLALFFRHRTPVDPYQPTKRLILAGPYRFSRNPLYLALVLLYAGLSVIVASLWMLLLIPVLFLLLHFGVVRREEEYLQGKFGEEYMEYKRRVRRWL